MADNVIINAATVLGGATIATEDVGGVQHELVKIEFGDDNEAIKVTESTPLPVTLGLTDAQLRATDIKVSLDSEVVAVSVDSLPLPNGAATSAKQLPDNHQVTVSNQVTQPLTDAQLRATPVPVSFSNSTPLFKGSSGTFRTLGRAGTTGQKIFAIHNATGSTVKVNVFDISVNLYSTVVKGILITPPVVRIWKFTDVPTNGSAVTKNKVGGSTISNSSVTVWGDSSADGVGSATTLTVTLPAGTIVDQTVAPRIHTAVGETNTIPMNFNFGDGLELGALEGLCVFLDYTVATSNPITDMWFVSCKWEER